MEEVDNRGKILNTALRIFAEKGYDGSRIDMIASEAGVNKALIYYYFKSKHEILDTLFHHFFEEVKIFLFSQFKEVDLRKESWTDELFLKSFSFLEERSDVLRLVMIESIKREPEGTHLFEFVDMILGEGPQSLIKFSEKFGVNFREISENLDQIRVTEFFTMLAPSILYLVFREKWEIFFKTNKDVFREQFISAVRMTHIASHHNL